MSHLPPVPGLTVHASPCKPLAIDTLLTRGEPTAVLWGPNGGVVGWGSAATFAGSSWAGTWRRWRDWADGVGLPQLRALASFTFDPRSSSQSSVINVPEVAYHQTPDGRACLVSVEEYPALPARRKPADVQVTLRDAAGDYPAAVRSGLRQIADGQVEKLVLSTHRDVTLVGRWHPTDLLAAMAPRYGQSWLYYVDGFVGASPELLARVDDGHVTAKVLAGTADDASELADPSTKLLREHELAAESVLDTLAGLGLTATSSGPYVLPLPHLAHLASDVSAPLVDGVGIFEALTAVHPTAAVGGVPRTAAMRLISRIEGFDRGRYAGPVGWVDAAGNGEFALGLRGGQRIDASTLRLFAGAGILDGSNPDDEWREVQTKFAPMLDACREISGDE